jgi:signal peptidase I
VHGEEQPMNAAQQAMKESPWKVGLFGILAFAVMVLALGSPLLIRTYLYQPFNVPSGSMIPTLRIGDGLFVSKYAYARIWGNVPARGDVIAFLSPKDNATVYIKRVVGLPGDRIQMKQGLLHINGTPVVRERVADFTGEDACGSKVATATKRWRETMPDGASYETLDCVDNGFYDNTNVYTVPDGHIFVLGDNRDNSVDSRVMSQMGYVPLENVIGRAGMIFFSSSPGERDKPGGVRWGRIGTLVK